DCYITCSSFALSLYLLPSIDIEFMVNFIKKIKSVIKKFKKKPKKSSHINEEINDICDVCKCKRNDCNVKLFQDNFKNWTSGNNDIDTFIQITQNNEHHYTELALEWIPYDKFRDIQYIAKGGF